MSIGSRIRSERKNQNLTLKKLAEKADISVSYLGDIEKERSKPSIDRLRDIALALGKSISYFVDENSFSEEESSYTPIDEETKILFNELIAVDGFKDILEGFRGFSDWTDREKAELAGFLKVKRDFRENTNR
ncbi:MAG: helix-turn-helix transcriptional regulator [Clostridiales bacterium]|nr:helix-turn-helix transcriptional regulator [Clostridiales bacterium]